ncbi:MAG: helix-turn-helix domain-containing protein [Cryomorphaceae bacterium]|nr:helix-turn-helix domain-containing protein [Cryomorphaceae bacterium]
MRSYRGIHPGFVLARLLKKRNIRQRTFALSIDEHPQTINAIIKGKRALNPSLAIKIEKKLNIEEGELAVLQVYYEIEKNRKKNQLNKPNLSLLRPSLFWDTDFKNLDWERKYKAVINRVFERGNAEEKKEILRFYGREKINATITGEQSEV